MALESVAWVAFGAHFPSFRKRGTVSLSWGAVVAVKGGSKGGRGGVVHDPSG
jgi:hypothetical protein